jgi:O-acetyl-ADP-ribose deacetylase (regulator of RNase III)
MAKGREAPAMTPGRAALIGLVYRYLAGLLDPFVTLLEVQKLMYFLQESGENLRLRYVKATYGPYAENLRHVLNAIEGHYISGYADGGDDPDKHLNLVPGAIAEANTFLANHPDTQKRFEQVVQLVDGFETPTSMELLATVHWVIKRESPKSRTDIVDAVHAWNDRKKAFTPRHIGIAYDALVCNGWIDHIAE